MRARQNDVCRAALAPAAELWAAFPATMDPRPLVLLSGPFRDAGFVDVEAQDAMAQGRVAVDGSVPPAAVDAMRIAGIVSTGTSDSPARVTAARLTTHPFRTDRGRQVLPAWELSISGGVGSSYLLTSPQQALEWSPPAVAERGSLISSSWAGVDPDGITLTYTFGGDSELCSRLHSVDVVETAGSVAVFPRLAGACAGRLAARDAGDGAADGHVRSEPPPRWPRAGGLARRTRRRDTGALVMTGNV